MMEQTTEIWLGDDSDKEYCPIFVNYSINLRYSLSDIKTPTHCVDNLSYKIENGNGKCVKETTIRPKK